MPLNRRIGLIALSSALAGSVIASQRRHRRPVASWAEAPSPEAPADAVRAAQDRSTAPSEGPAPQNTVAQVAAVKPRLGASRVDRAPSAQALPVAPSEIA